MQIANNKVVSIDYTLTSASGKVIDSSQGREPLVYLQGVGNIIPGLERQLEGKSVGEELRVTVPASEAYGERDEDLVQPIPRQAFANVPKLEPGMQLRAQGPDGAARIVTVKKVEPEQVTVDANHPLAGMPLTFDVKVVAIRDATEDEKQHGHAHGPGGHQH